MVEDLKAKAKLEIEKALHGQESGEYGKVPDWVKKLNVNAAFAGTIRIKVKNGTKDPAKLSFREKLLLFTGE